MQASLRKLNILATWEQEKQKKIKMGRDVRGSLRRIRDKQFSFDPIIFLKIHSYILFHRNFYHQIRKYLCERGVSLEMELHSKTKTMQLPNHKIGLNKYYVPTFLPLTDH